MDFREKTDAVLLCSYGGPRAMDEVLPFMRNATRGRGIPDERLIAVSKHYALFGGASPINERNEELRAALEAELGIPVTVGNRNWTPYFTDALEDLARRGLYRVACLFTSAYASYSGCRQYREDIAAALSQVETASKFRLRKIETYYTLQGMLDAAADTVTRALRGRGETHLVCVTHSIPLTMEENSACETKPSYRRQHELFGSLLCREVSRNLRREIRLDLAYCSRSGSPRQRWLEPDINDRLRALAADGVKSVAVFPIGFITDHMEVVYDLDTEAAQTARELKLDYLRIPTLGTHPAFVRGLADLVRGNAKHCLAQVWDAECGAQCCVPQKNYTFLPTVFTGKKING